SSSSTTPFWLWLENLKQPFRQTWIFKNRAEQDQTHARILVSGNRHQCLSQFGISSKAFRAADEPEVELVFVRADIGDALGRETLRIVDKIAGMHFEKARQQHACRVGHMRSCAALDPREIRLADRFAQLFFD